MSGVRLHITEATATLALGVSASTTPRSNSTLNDCCYIDKSNSKCSNYKQSLRTGLGETLHTLKEVSEIYLSTVGLGCGPAKRPIHVGRKTSQHKEYLSYKPILLEICSLNMKFGMFKKL